MHTDAKCNSLKLVPPRPLIPEGRDDAVEVVVRVLCSGGALVAMLSSPRRRRWALDGGDVDLAPLGLFLHVHDLYAHGGRLGNTRTF